MDNLCHTLVGAALGEAGFKRRTRFASATLMIASNLPDIDVLGLRDRHSSGRLPAWLDPRHPRGCIASSAACRRDAVCGVTASGNVTRTFD
jgi:hypothetical protein